MADDHLTIECDDWLEKDVTGHRSTPTGDALAAAQNGLAELALTVYVLHKVPGCESLAAPVPWQSLTGAIDTLLRNMDAVSRFFPLTRVSAGRGLEDWRSSEWERRVEHQDPAVGEDEPSVVRRDDEFDKVWPSWPNRTWPYIEQAGAEMAVAKLMGREFEKDTPGHVGPWTVRHRGGVYESDGDDDIVIFVDGSIPTYVVHGWLCAREAKRPNRWDSRWWHQEYVVSLNDLHPMDALPGYVPPPHTGAGHEGIVERLADVAKSNAADEDIP